MSVQQRSVGKMEFRGALEDYLKYRYHFSGFCDVYGSFSFLNLWGFSNLSKYQFSRLILYS